MKTVAVFFADGFEEIEGLSPVDYLRRAEIDVITVGVVGKYTSDAMIVTSSHKIPIVVDMDLAGYLSIYGKKLPDCVVCPGGSVGAENLGNCDELLEHLENCWENDKVVAAICAAPAVVLGKTNIPSGKKWTCYPGMQTESDPSFVSGYANDVVITDGNLVTARGPGASEQFAMELVRILAGQDIYDKIRAGSQQR